MPKFSLISCRCGGTPPTDFLPVGHTVTVWLPDLPLLYLVGFAKHRPLICPHSRVAMQTPISIVSSFDDLVARCTVANERKLSKSSEPESVVDFLGLPIPAASNNAQMKGLKPIYMDAINDIRERSSGGRCMEILRAASHDEPDAAITLLYFLEFPHLVRACRGDVSGIGKCKVNEAYDFADIADAIATSIIPWCRRAIASPDEHHSLVLASSISLIDSLARPSAPSAKKNIEKLVFGDGRKVMDGFEALRSDLAKVVSRPDVTRDTAANAILIQFHILLKFFDEDRVSEVVAKPSNREAFEGALKRHRHSFDNDGQYQAFRGMIGCSWSLEETVMASQAFQKKEAQREVYVCERDGCDKPGASVCSRCRLVGYCSRECQVNDWRTHKLVCKKTRSTSASGAQQATKSARSMINPALDRQNKFLAENPTFDYRIVLPTGDQDFGVCLDNPMGKVMFRLFRSKAGEGSANAVFRMYDFLIGRNADLKGVIRRQLHAEYGVDPLSDEAKNGESIPPSREEIANVMMTMGGMSL